MQDRVLINLGYGEKLVWVLDGGTITDYKNWTLFLLVILEAGFGTICGRYKRDPDDWTQFVNHRVEYYQDFPKLSAAFGPTRCDYLECCQAEN